MKVYESKDVELYKLLLNILADHCKKFPATGIDVLFDLAVDKGKSVIPKDKFAQNILSDLLSASSSAEAVSNLLNKRFSELSTPFRPMYKDGRKTRCAFWAKDGHLYDIGKDLLSFEGGKGKWVDMNGNSVTLLDLA